MADVPAHDPDGPDAPDALAAAHAATRAPYAFRRHQREALDALGRARAGGRSRAWLTLPPGAGKTLVGLETIRREARPAVVLCPNTAVQGQWVRGWGAMRGPGPEAPVTVGTDRGLEHPVTVLTYQSLAVFAADTDGSADGEADGEAEGEADGAGVGTGDGAGAGSELDRLHPNGLALVARLRALGPLTLVLDECHHLLETWGRLLAEVLEQLPDAVVLGLTATPPATLRGAQAELVDALFGEIVYAASVPAVVREGHLAPFADLVWLTTPTAAEDRWLAESRTRFAELVTGLLDPSFGSTPFLVWCDQRFAGELGFHRVAERDPALADAALRLRHAGLLQLRSGDHVHSAERHRRPPDAEDWGLLLGDWYDGCLADATDPADERVREALRRALPAVGWQLTRRGLRRGRSTVDRVLARSAAKARALVEIVAAEHRVLGDRLAMLVVCDHEDATATVPADLTGVVTERAGSARAALAALLADPVCAGLSPVMVTGRTVAAAPATLDRLRARLPGTDLRVGAPDDDGVAELTGAWTSRTWVRAVTDFLAEGGAGPDGGCSVLVGTRALLGEGWDAPGLTGLVDLGTATTAGSVVQTRGRSLRLDPDDPDKVAVNWTVCTVAPEHPRGDADWRRTVRKHEGYLGVDATGEVVDGIAHIHPSFSPWEAPEVAGFDAVNAAMLLRAERRADLAAAWAVGTPYDDTVRVAAWLRPVAERAPGRARAAGDDGDDGHDGGGPGAPPSAVLGPDGLVLSGSQAWPRGVPRAVTVGAGLLVPVLVGAMVVLGWSWPVALAVLAAATATAVALGVDARAVERRRTLLEVALRPTDLLDVAAAVADGLRGAGMSAAGAEAVRWRPDADGVVRVSLDGSGGSALADSELFAEALAEVTGPVEQPRYLVPRWERDPPADRREARALARPGDVLPSRQVWHAVPTVLGSRRTSADAFAAAWRHRVGGGAAVYVGSPEGAGALAAARGADPMVTHAVLRTRWH